jgi:peptide/nickel transport system substrate-binding protein
VAIQAGKGRQGLGWLFAVVVVQGFILLGLFASADAARKKIVKIAYKEQETLDPHVGILGQTQASLRLLYRGLTRFAIREVTETAPDGTQTVKRQVTTTEVEPDLAQSWTVSHDGTVWTFTLRQGVQFHKEYGEMTAEDVKYSFERQMRRERGMRFAKNLDVIQDITVLDSYTVRITLKQYDPVFPLRMAGYQQGYIVSRKAALEFGDEFGWNPVGTGPFYFHRHLPREKIIFRAFREYYGGRPVIDEIHWFDVPEDATKLIGLEKGTFDIVAPNIVTPDVKQQVAEMDAVMDERGPGGQFRFYFNLTKPPFDDLRVRRAFMHAIDRQAIVDTLWPDGLGTVAYSPLPPGYFGHLGMEMPAYNPELARQLLAEAGYPDGLTIEDYFITRSYGYPKIMTMVQEQLKHVGVDVRLQLVEHPTYHRNIRNNLNPFVLYGGTRLTDGDVMLSLFFHSSEAPDPATGNKGTNFAHYRGIDDLLEAGRRTRDSEQRAALYHEAQRRIMRDAVCLPIVDIPSRSIRHPARVSTPFDPKFGEYAIHNFYTYPELFDVVE